MYFHIYKYKFLGFGTNTSQGGLFGQQQTQPAQSTGLFGNTATSKPLFTTTSTASTGGFGGFGTTQPATVGTTGLFGQTQQKQGGLFSSVQTTQTSALFANPTPAVSSTGFQGFGTGFGTNTNQQQQQVSVSLTYLINFLGFL